ncbi:O-antigen ligase family protein, partial [Candidatus Peregrinibacteria bacterium]|nr:O-antigen ligase family protein [Candidatus Peregrinibacteria bacterium]
MMPLVLFFSVAAVEAFAFFNRGGGPLLSHLFLTLAVFGAAAAAVFAWRKEKTLFYWRREHTAYALFLGFFTVSMAFSLTPGYGLSELLLFVNGGLLLMLFSNASITEKSAPRFGAAVMALAVLDALAGFFLYTGTPFPRFAGTFLDMKAPYTSFANDFANFLLLILPFALWSFFRNHERRTMTILTGLAAAILVSTFLLTFSRAAWLSGAALLGIFLAWKAAQKIKNSARNVKSAVAAQNLSTQAVSRRDLAMRSLALAMAVVLLINGAQFARSQKHQTTRLMDKLLFRADEGTASVSERRQFWIGAAKLIADRPVFGGGVLSFRYLYPKYQTDFEVNWDHPHNIFLKIGVENGVPAMLLFAVFIALAAVRLLKFFWAHPRHPAFFLSLGAAGSFGHNLLDFNYIVSNFTLFIAFIGISLAFAAAEERKACEAESQPSKALARGKLWPAALPAVSFFMIIIGLHEAWYNVPFKKGRAALSEGRPADAVILLEKARKLFFPRDLSRFLAAAYVKQYAATSDETWRQKEKIFLGEVSRNAADAAIFGRLGEIYAEESNPSEAAEKFLRALEIDPMNRFRYYYGFFTSYNDLKPQDSRQNFQARHSALEKKARGLLMKYP